MHDETQPASEGLDSRDGNDAEAPTPAWLVHRAREEVDAALAVLGDPMTRPASALVHLLRAWELVARADGNDRFDADDLVSWIRTRGLRQLGERRRARTAATAARIVELAASDDAPAPEAVPTRRRLRAHAVTLKDIVAATALDLDGWSLRNQRIERWARRAIIALFVLVPILAYGWLVARESGPGKWRGAYFPYDNFNGVPVVRRDDDIAFNWGRRRPMVNIPADNFSVRWDSCLEIHSPTRAAFQLISNNDSRLYIDGNLAVDNWNNKGRRTRGSWYDLTSGTHHLRVEYRERYKHALMYLLATFDDDPPRRIPDDMLTYPGDDAFDARPCSQ